jgi:crotonobetainyl-CoA:carnitine CoA-transferase CaiB-like acyl-CoA transferase
MTPLEQVWHVARCDPAALSRVAVTGGDPQLPSVYRVAGLATAVIAAEALAAAECFRVRTGREQQVEVDARRACVAFRSERYLRIDNGPAPEMRDPLTGFFETRDGRWIQLHANFAHHRAGIVKLLGCADDPDSVAAAIRNRDGAALDQALGEAGLCAALIRSPEEWAALPQAQAVAKLPLMEIERIGDAPAMPIGDPAGAAPLSGVRALDLSRFIAGPVGGRTLAQHCADVLLINGPHLPNIAPLVIDNGRGKRSATLDLREPRGRDSLRTLLGQSDVFLQSYRRGFDSLVQSASGIAWTEARAAGQEKPRHLPCQALDHATGYLAAFGAMVALLRRATEGGSWLVRVSLAQTGRWLQSMDTLDGGQRTQDPTFDDVQDALMTMDSPFGKLTCTQPAERMPLTPPRWTRPPVPIGTDEARW